jgi:hypothetical protein
LSDTDLSSGGGGQVSMVPFPPVSDATFSMNPTKTKTTRVKGERALLFGCENLFRTDSEYLPLQKASTS